MSSLRFTETTIRNLLLKELERRGVKAATEVSYRTPIGVMKPDALLQNGGQYIVETKLGAAPKLFDAMVQLYDYTKYIETVGGFAILLPAELRRPVPIDWLQRMAMASTYKYVVAGTFKDDRPSQRFIGTLSEVADWIAEQVLKEPKYAEPDASLAIEVLNDAVDAINVDLSELQESELEDVFGGKSVFENILQYEIDKYPVSEMRRAATYLLINQILFYQILSNINPAAYPVVNEELLEGPNSLTTYFSNVLQHNYASTFGFDIASRLPEKSLPTIKRVIAAIKALAPEKIRRDILGQVFHNLIPFEIRKSVAAFYTNNNAAAILAQLSIDDPNAEVMDLAVGSGTLLVAAYRRKRELIENQGAVFQVRDHLKYLEEDLTGIDIMPFAAHLAVVHLSIQALPFEADKVRVAVWDSTELQPGRVIPAISRELKEAYKKPSLEVFFQERPEFKKAFVEKGVITMNGMGGGEIPLRKADIIIMNPPFTRQERLPKEYKDSLNSRLKEYEDRLHGQLGLYGYFTFLADMFLKVGGRLALVLPATVLRIASAQGIRDLLTDDYEFEYIITTYQRAAFSEGAQFREILLVARKTPKKAVEQALCTVAFLKSLPKDTSEARELSNELRIRKDILSIGETFDSEKLSVRNVSQHMLQENSKNLFKFIACEDVRLPDTWDKVEKKAHKKLIPFSQNLTKLGGEIEEGVRARSHLLRAPIGSMFILCAPSRANKRFDRWVVKNITDKNLTAENLIDHRSVKIPLKSLQYGLRRLSGVDTIDLSDKLDFILLKKFPQIQDFFLSENVDNILRDLPQWRKYVNQKLSKLVVAFRFDMSAKGTLLFAWHSPIPIVGCGVVWNITGLDDEDAKILTLWFNSTLSILQSFLNRVETRGAWMQFHKYVMNDLMVLNPLSLSDHERKVILETYTEIKDVKFPSFLEQLKQGHLARKKIDKIILKILGFNEEEISGLLAYLYPALHKEILRLKELMAG